MQRLFEPFGCIGHSHSFLLTVFMQQMRRIQIQRVATKPGTEPVSTPTPDRTKGAQVVSRSVELLKKPTQSGLAANALNAQHRWQGRIAAQKSHLRQFFSSLQKPRHKSQS